MVRIKQKSKSDWRLSPGTINIHFSDVIAYDMYTDMTVEGIRDYARNKFEEYVD